MTAVMSLTSSKNQYEMTIQIGRKIQNVYPMFTPYVKILYNVLVYRYIFVILAIPIGFEPMTLRLEI